MDEPHAVAALGLVEIRGGDEDGYLLPQQLIKNPPKIPPRDRIDAVGRLVQEQHLGGVNQGAGQTQLLLHSARQIAGPASLERRQIAEGQQPLDSFLPAAARFAVNVGIEVDVLHHRQVGIETEPLTHVADVFLDLLGLADRMPAGHPGLRRRRGP